MFFCHERSHILSNYIAIKLRHSGTFKTLCAAMVKILSYSSILKDFDLISLDNFVHLSFNTV